MGSASSATAPTPSAPEAFSEFGAPSIMLFDIRTAVTADPGWPSWFTGTSPLQGPADRSRMGPRLTERPSSYPTAVIVSAVSAHDQDGAILGHFHLDTVTQSQGQASRGRRNSRLGLVRDLAVLTTRLVRLARGPTHLRPGSSRARHPSPRPYPRTGRSGRYRRGGRQGGSPSSSPPGHRPGHRS